MKKDILFSLISPSVLIEKGLKFPSFFNTFFKKVLQFWLKKDYKLHPFSILFSEKSFGVDGNFQYFFYLYVLQFWWKKDWNFHTFSILFSENSFSLDGKIKNVILFLFICPSVLIEKDLKLASIFHTFFRKVLQFGWKFSILFYLYSQPLV